MSEYKMSPELQECIQTFRSIADLIAAFMNDSEIGKLREEMSWTGAEQEFVLRRINEIYDFGIQKFNTHRMRNLRNYFQKQKDLLRLASGNYVTFRTAFPGFIEALCDDYYSADLVAKMNLTSENVFTKFCERKFSKEE